MKNESATLITIFTETALETKLIKDMERLGAPGYTITNARGKGAQGVRDASWGASANIRVEVLCSQAVAEKITAHIEETYYDNYAMVSFVTRVDVLRPEKFVG